MWDRSLRFAVAVAIAKYADHAPLTRLCRVFDRQGLDVDSQTLWDQLDGLAQHHVPAYDKLREHILGADVVGADETWWRLMDGKGKSTKRWWAWSLTSVDALWHGIAPSRSAEAARQYLGDFEGTLLVDGYKAYDTLAKHNKGICLAHGWAHARRNFVEAEPNYPQCSEALDLIGQLFEIDRGTEDPRLLEDGEAPGPSRRSQSSMNKSESISGTYSGRRVTPTPNSIMRRAQLMTADEHEAVRDRICEILGFPSKPTGRDEDTFVSARSRAPHKTAGTATAAANLRESARTAGRAILLAGGSPFLSRRREGRSPSSGRGPQRVAIRLPSRRGTATLGAGSRGRAWDEKIESS